MTSVIHDARLALRGLVDEPISAAIVILTLGLGIGSNTAVFSVVDGVLLRPLPFPGAERRERFAVFVMAVSAGLGLTLAAVGIYGVVSYLGSQRTAEVGMRVAPAPGGAT